VHSILLIQELQANKFKQDNNSDIKQVRFIKLLCADCHKQVVLISESHCDSNRCTTYRGKSDQHITHFACSINVWFSTIRISYGPHIATFRTVINRFEQIHYPREEGLPTQSIARRLADPWVRTQLLSHNSQ
jgi:hypothetical protein